MIGKLFLAAAIVDYLYVKFVDYSPSGFQDATALAAIGILAHVALTRINRAATN